MNHKIFYNTINEQKIIQDAEFVSPPTKQRWRVLGLWKNFNSDNNVENKALPNS